MSLARSTKFGINVDFERSHGMYIYDKNTDREILDFFGMYASLPLGYNHPIFKTPEFVDEYLRASSLKINNCEFVSDETLEFDRMFTEYAGVGIYRNIHYSCTGALAVEAAIKTCIRYKNFHSPKILSFHNSFHGINSYGGFITSRFSGADKRLKGFPEVFSIKVEPDLHKVEANLRNGDITCLLVEPIQCSAGDIHHNKSWDGDISDMIRCKYIIKAYEKYDILSNVEKMSKLLSSSLSQMPEILNLRNCGLIFGFDLTSTRYRDILIKNAYENGMICNIAGKTSIRLRPSLSVTEKDIEQATSIFKSSMRK